jgi:hypothetical protein
MAKQLATASLFSTNKKARCDEFIVQTTGKKKITNRIAIFFNRISPANWFNEFSDLSITMEEFGAPKK